MPVFNAASSDAPLFVSPHLDDAVFACGELITSSPRSTVVTVFAGRPPAGTRLAAWDADAGFAEGDDVIGARREEDREAMAALGARALWLDFCDDQYGVPAEGDAIENALSSLLASGAFAAVYFPLGLFHSDHARASDATLAVATRFAALPFIAYEDALYRRIPDLVERRLAHIASLGYAVTPMAVSVDRAAAHRKRVAVACYRSQIRALATRRGHADAFEPERYWRVRSGRA